MRLWSGIKWILGPLRGHCKAFALKDYTIANNGADAQGCIGPIFVRSLQHGPNESLLLTRLNSWIYSLHVHVKTIDFELFLCGLFIIFDSGGNYRHSGMYRVNIEEEG